MAVTKENYTGIIDDILRNYQTKILKNTSTVQEIRIEDNQRAAVRDQVESSLRSQGIIYGELTRNVGSFGGTEIVLFGKKIRFIYKLRSVSAGSGAGAALTRLSESAQCAYAAIAFGLGRSIKNNDVTTSNLSRYSGTFFTDEDTTKIANSLPDDWVESSVFGANKLLTTFGRGGRYTFHRGDGVVSRINNAFMRVKRIENVRMDVNKWNPSDFWMVERGFDFGRIDGEQTLLGLNQVIQESLQEKSLIGISLKKMQGGASLSKKNITSNMNQSKEYTGFSYSRTSMDGYILLSGGTKIQYRSFGGPSSLTGFQGEVKGANANQGKISLGPTNMILRTYGLPTVPTNAAARVRTDPISVWNEISVGLRTYARMNQKQIDTLRDKVNQSWLYSKLQVTQLIGIIESIKNRNLRNQLVEDLYLYASSQSRFSSAYYKLE